ncbi:MAG: diguanylate cyclase [Acidobacteria bacterium]|nr:diguanylate cyclase [Acidobacteriota bacterium]
MVSKQEVSPSFSLTTKAYIYSVNVVGCGVLAFSLYQVSRSSWEWIFLAALASMGGFFSVKVPTRGERGDSVTLTLSDVFIYVAILWYGPHTAVVISALDTLLGNLRNRQRGLYKILFNFSNLAITTLIASKIFYHFYSEGRFPVNPGPPQDVMKLFIALGVSSITLFLLNSGSVALAICLVTKTKLLELWRNNFLWTSLTNFAGAAAAIVLLYLPKERIYFVAVTVPIVLMIYFTYKVYLENITQAKKHVQELNELYHSTISSLAMAIDAKDQTTHGHVRRVQSFALGLAELAGVKDENELEGLRAASLLHDVGKLAIPEYILNKPTALTPAEFQKMQVHPNVGADILSSVNFPFPVVPTVKHHHEKWDGTGYPDALEGENIPLGARILAIADCYDALRSDRPYRAELSREIALDYIQKEAAKSYDPELVHLFAGNIEMLEERARKADASLPEKVMKSIGASVAAEVSSRKKHIEATVFHDIAASHKEIQAMYELSQNVGKSLNVSETMAIVASRIKNIIPYSACGIFLIDSGGDKLSCFYTAGAHAEQIEKLHLAVGEGVSGWVVANNQPILNASPAADFAESRQLQNSFKSCLSVPLSIEGSLVGVISLYSEFPKNYSQDHLRLLETISRQAAIAINNSLIFEETQEDAFTDVLTGLPNSRYLYIFLDQEFRRAERLNYPVSILVMDLEKFKAVNDNYGHQVGDRMLVEISHILRNQMRKSDTCVRYAGDEFVAVLSGANRRQAEDNTSRIQNAVDNHDLIVDNFRIRVGISVGCATFPDDGRDAQMLIALADQNMYADKLRRTNRKLKSKPRKVISFDGRPSG